VCSSDLFVDWYEVILFEIVFSAIRPTEAALICEELSNFRKVLLLGVLLESSLVVVRDSDSLKDYPYCSI